MPLATLTWESWQQKDEFLQQETENSKSAAIEQVALVAEEVPPAFSTQAPSVQSKSEPAAPPPGPPPAAVSEDAPSVSSKAGGG